MNKRQSGVHSKNWTVTLSIAFLSFLLGSNITSLNASREFSKEKPLQAEGNLPVHPPTPSKEDEILNLLRSMKEELREERDKATRDREDFLRRQRETENRLIVSNYTNYGTFGGLGTGLCIGTIAHHTVAGAAVGGPAGALLGAGLATAALSMGYLGAKEGESKED